MDLQSLTLDPLWAMEPAAFGRFVELLRADLPLAAMSAHHDAAAPAPYHNRNGVAVIPFQGVVNKRNDREGLVSTLKTQSAIAQAVADPAAHSLLLLIDSPGGTVAGTADLAEAFAAAGQKKPTVAYASDLAASAAYWVGSQAGAVWLA